MKTVAGISTRGNRFRLSRDFASSIRLVTEFLAEKSAIFGIALQSHFFHLKMKYGSAAATSINTIASG